METDEIVINWSPLEVYDLSDPATLEKVRSMTTVERVAEMQRMTNDKRRDVAEQIRRARPDWTEDQVDREFRWVWLCEAGMDEVTKRDVREIYRPPSLGYQ